MAESLLVETQASDTSADARNDQQLIAAINRGDPAAFEALYFRYRDWVVALACRFTGDPDAALDVMQETFLYVLRKFPGFRLTAHFKTFLYPAVRNLSIAVRRKAGRFQESGETTTEEFPDPNPATAATDDLSSALAHLPEEHREVLLLRFVDDLSLAEIAATLDVPLGTVKSRLHYALDSLRRDPRTKELFSL